MYGLAIRIANKAEFDYSNKIVWSSIIFCVVSSKSRVIMGNLSNFITHSFFLNITTIIVIVVVVTLKTK